MLLVRGGSTTLDMISGERIGRKEIYGSDDVPPWVESLYWEFATNQFKHENTNDVCIMYGMRKKSTVFL